ncbi:MAG: hypothetical protein ACE5H1_11170 [Thermodesulfobacteriota bacterium]
MRTLPLFLCALNILIALWLISTPRSEYTRDCPKCFEPNPDNEIKVTLSTVFLNETTNIFTRQDDRIQPNETLEISPNSEHRILKVWVNYDNSKLKNRGQ